MVVITISSVLLKGEADELQKVHLLRKIMKKNVMTATLLIVLCSALKLCSFVALCKYSKPHITCLLHMR